MTLENRMVLDEDLYIENDSEEYFEYLCEEDDRVYQDIVYERIMKNNE